METFKSEVIRTDQFTEESLIELSVSEAQDMLLRGGAGNGAQLRSHGTILGQAGQPDGEHPDVVLFGLSSSCHRTGAARVVCPIDQQQRHPQAAGRRLTAEHLGGIGDGVGCVGAMANEGHGSNTALEDVQVLPVSEVVLHRNGAAVLKSGQAGAQPPAGRVQLHEPGAETQNELLLSLKQRSFGFL